MGTSIFGRLHIVVTGIQLSFLHRRVSFPVFYPAPTLNGFSDWVSSSQLKTAAEFSRNISIFKPKTEFREQTFLFLIRFSLFICVLFFSNVPYWTTKLSLGNNSQSTGVPNHFILFFREILFNQNEYYKTFFIILKFDDIKTLYPK